MKIDFKKKLILGCLILLLVNVVEFRSGTLLALIQLVLGLLVFVPRLVSNSFLKNIKPYDPILKYVYLFAVVWGIYREWYYAPNHLFLFFFLSVLVLTSEDENHIKNNFRWIFVVIMGFATVHKLGNPTFFSGDFIGFRIASGDFFRPIWMSGIAPEISEIFMGNATEISALESRDPSLGEIINLNMGSIPFSRLNHKFTYAIIGTEFLLAMLFALFSATRVAFTTLLIFVASIGLVVSEFEFACTLLFMGLCMCPNKFGLLKGLYWCFFLLYAFLSIVHHHF